NLRGIQDAYMSSKGLDYFQNSGRAVQAQYAYAIANPLNWQGYGANLWGLTACDGPGAVAINYEGQTRQLLSYAARGVGLTSTTDDGTIAPTAVLGSLPFAPELVVPTAVSMYETYGTLALGTYGFLDAFNLSVPAGTPITQGQFVAGSGWVDTQYLGIDQGPIIAMAENYRSGLIWSTMQQNTAIVLGLQRAGFSGGWLG
ncbi:MAG TPA: glucoamylase family protein, partial [Steroidobacteraceae bacterium]